MQSRIQEKRSEIHKEEYGSPKRESKLNFQETEKSKVILKQPKIIDPNSGFAMLITPNSNFIMNKTTCYIGKKLSSNQLEQEDA